MDLFELNLHKELVYIPVDYTNWEDLAKLAKNLKEGDEMLIGLCQDNLVYEDENGPHVSAPLPRPLLAGIKPDSLHTQDIEHPDVIVIPKGLYLFVQGRYKDTGSVHELFDWFVREAWWQREHGTGNYYVRLVHEDGKTAIQIMRALISRNSL